MSLFRLFWVKKPRYSEKKIAKKIYTSIAARVTSPKMAMLLTMVPTCAGVSLWSVVALGALKA